MTIRDIEESRPNYYRRTGLRAVDVTALEPFPLHVKEHTAQIGVDEALARERHFNPIEPVVQGSDLEGTRHIGNRRELAGWWPGLGANQLANRGQ